MSKLTHSDDAGMAVVERNRAIEDGELRQCTTCGAENFVDDPVCPRGATGCNVVTPPPKMNSEGVA